MCFATTKLIDLPNALHSTCLSGWSNESLRTFLQFKPNISSLVFRTPRRSVKPALSRRLPTVCNEGSRTWRNRSHPVCRIIATHPDEESAARVCGAQSQALLGNIEPPNLNSLVYLSSCRANHGNNDFDIVSRLYAKYRIYIQPPYPSTARIQSPAMTRG